MTTIRRIPTSKVDGNGANATSTNEIRPYGELAVYVGDNNKLELLMFDGARNNLRSKVLSKGTFYGGDADSGDGAGLDTIKLIPDAELYQADGDYNNDQYLIVDPTGPNHIHLRAGGTIDQSNADLFLGGEKNHVMVSDTSDSVVISTDIGEGTQTWTFGADGGLILSSGGLVSEGFVTNNTTIQLTPANPAVVSQKLVIKGGGLYNVDENGIAINWNQITAQVGDTIPFYIYAPTFANQTLYWWIHPAGAGISDPEFGTVEIDGNGYGTVSINVDSDDYEFTLRISPVQNNYEAGVVGVETSMINGDAPSFADHHLHLTTGDLSETSIFLGTDNHNVRTTTNGTIQITTPTEGTNVWEFKTDGNLTVPGNLNSLVTPQVGTIITDIPTWAFESPPGSFVWTDVSNLSVNLLRDAGSLVGWVLVSNNQVAYTITDYLSNMGIVSVTTDNPLQSGETYSAHSPDYVAKVAPPIGINVDENLWAFGSDGALTLPGNSKISYNTITNAEIISGPIIRQTTITTDAWGGELGGSGNGIAVLANEESRKIVPGWTVDFSNSSGVFTVTNVSEMIDGFGLRIRMIDFQEDVSGLNYPIVATSPVGAVELKSGENSWVFRGDNLTLPNDASIAVDNNNIEIRNVANFNVEASSVVNIYTDSAVNSYQWQFGDDGSLIFPDLTVQTTAYTGITTVSKTGIDPLTGGLGRAATITVSPSNNTNLTVGTVNNITFGAGFTLNVTVAANGDITADVVSSDQTQSVGNFGMIIGGGSLGGTTPADDITFTVSSLTDVILPTVLDLTKSINKLTDGIYNLLDGVEGQIMYLVRQNGSSGATTIIITNSRVNGTTYFNTQHYPFTGGSLTDITMLIFTDGAWQSNNGSWI